MAMSARAIAWPMPRGAAIGVVPITARTAMNTAPTTTSPWASARTRVRRWTSVKPSAMSPYAAPVARPVTSAWTATGPLISRDRVPDPQLALAERDDLDVDGLAFALEVRLGLGALLLVLREHLEAGLLERVGGRVALLHELLGVAVDRAEEALGLAERALGLVDVHAVEHLHLVRNGLLGLAVDVADLGALLAAGLLGLLLLLLALLFGLAFLAL